MYICVPKRNLHVEGLYPHAVRHKGRRDEQRWRVAVLKVWVVPAPGLASFAPVSLLARPVHATLHVLFLWAIGIIQSRLFG